MIGTLDRRYVGALLSQIISTVRGGLVGVWLALFALVYGVTFGNVSAWAAEARAIVVSSLVLAGLIMLWRAHIELLVGQAIFVGLLVAMAVSNSYHTTGNYGIVPWLVYLGAFALQRAIQRDWRDDLSIFCVVMSIYAVIMIMAHQTLEGPVNRNYIALLITLTAPAMIARWSWRGAAIAFIAILTGARGAMVGLAVVALVMINWTRKMRWVAWPAATAGAVGLIFIRPATIITRAHLAMAAISDWWDTSPLFGLGPGGIFVEGWRVGDQFMSRHAHSVLVSIAAQVGVAGLIMFGVVLALTRYTPLRLQRWQWATLAASGALSFVEDLAVWWPVGIIVCLVAASNLVFICSSPVAQDKELV